MEALRCAGFQDLSLDLIFGLAGPTWPGTGQADLDRAFGLEPEHLSLYGLTVEPHTVLGHWAGRGELTPVDEERYAAEFLAAHQALCRPGLRSLRGLQCRAAGHRARHNSAYWQRAPFIGLGPSAHSGFGRERRWNVREWADVRARAARWSSPLDGREVLDESAIRLEELYLGLRTQEWAGQSTSIPSLPSEATWDRGAAGPSSQERPDPAHARKAGSVWTSLVQRSV